MEDIGKNFILIGAVIVLAGVCLSFLGKFTSLGKLPGDIFIKRENFTFYFPFTTCLLLSLLLTLVFTLFGKR